MGHWGVKSYENDDAADALDAGFDRVHGDRYNELMDDASPLTFEQVQERLASPETLAAAIAALERTVGAPFEEWDEMDRLAFAGIVVRHAELAVPIPDVWRLRALGWLEDEGIDWDEATVRKLRREKEIRLLVGAGGMSGPDHA
ncbi:MAG: hypothetical protein P4L84_23245 [Isosphaeraceae bacterium]|nr:hypothetical protein [Isosphaeraceae bacterium]